MWTSRTELREMSMQSETAIVTGATSGLGKRITEYILEASCRVAICSRSAEHVNETLAELSGKYGEGRIIGYPCDVADAAAIKNSWRRWRASSGRSAFSWPMPA